MFQLRKYIDITIHNFILNIHFYPQTQYPISKADFNPQPNPSIPTFHLPPNYSSPGCPSTIVTIHVFFINRGAFLKRGPTSRPWNGRGSDSDDKNGKREPGIKKNGKESQICHPYQMMDGHWHSTLQVKRTSGILKLS